MVRGSQLVCLLVFLAATIHSQIFTLQGPATVSFTLDFPASTPAHYSVEIQSDGKAHYESRSKVSSESEETDSFDYDFTVSPAAREKIFELTAKAGYFHKDLDSHRKNLAFTGKKTLGYKDERRSGESTFNYSPDGAVQDLTSLFQGLSATLELGHRLEYSLRYQKLALAEELKRTEESARMNPPVEIQAIAPILQQIVADSSVMNVTRARAQRLLDGPSGH
jgi:hypothetical protein